MKVIGVEELCRHPCDRLSEMSRCREVEKYGVRMMCDVCFVSTEQCRLINLFPLIDFCFALEKSQDLVPAPAPTLV